MFEKNTAFSIRFPTIFYGGLVVQMQMFDNELIAVGETLSYTQTKHPVTNIQLQNSTLSFDLHFKPDQWTNPQKERTLNISVADISASDTTAAVTESGKTTTETVSIVPCTTISYERFEITLLQAMTTGRDDFRDIRLIIHYDDAWCESLHAYNAQVSHFSPSCIRLSSGKVSGTVPLLCETEIYSDYQPFRYSIAFSGQYAGGIGIGEYIITGHEARSSSGSFKLRFLPQLDATNRTFVHPGLLNTESDFKRIEEYINREKEPWLSAFYALQLNCPEAHKPRPTAFYRMTVHHSEHGLARDLILDAAACYKNALLWRFTGDSSYSGKAIEIISEWVSVMKRIVREKQQYLSTSYSWPAMVWAAEILRDHPKMNMNAWISFLRDKILPFARVTLHRNNWASWAICCHISIAIHIDDPLEFAWACDRWRDLVTSYIRSDGITSETHRDLIHCQMGLAPLLAAAECAWHQGVDLYSFADNRLAKAVEFHVPFVLGETSGWPGGEQNPPSDVGVIWPMYELALYHYQGRQKIPMPNSTHIAMTHRPEKFNRIGLGTLTHAIEGLS